MSKVITMKQVREIFPRTPKWEIRDGVYYHIVLPTLEMVMWIEKERMENRPNYMYLPVEGCDPTDEEVQSIADYLRGRKPQM